MKRNKILAFFAAAFYILCENYFHIVLHSAALPG